MWAVVDMQILLNEKPIFLKDNETLFSLQSRYFPTADVVILNGFPVSCDHPLKEGDEVILFQKGKLPSKEELEYLMAARHTPRVHKKLKAGRVAICGCGGLGSHIATALARSGVGELLLVDFDVVEPTNLNRQQYFIEQLGMYKTDALKEEIQHINPFITVRTKSIRLTEENVYKILSGYPIIAEALDNPEAKAMLVSTVLQKMPDAKIVAGSGMAGMYDSNRILTKHPIKNLYLCGDGESEAKPGDGLMAPRVMICAGHQSNMILRLLCKEEDGE